MLVLAAAGVGIVAELLVGSAETMAQKLGWNHIFVGVIVLAIIGNAAEHSTAILVARRNDMDTAMTITYQSSLQIALFVTPFLVLLSAVFVAMRDGARQAPGPALHPDGSGGGAAGVLIVAFLGHQRGDELVRGRAAAGAVRGSSNRVLLYPQRRRGALRS